MNMSPQQIGEMSIWQFFAMVDGMSDDDGRLSADEADGLWEFINGH